MTVTGGVVMGKARGRPKLDEAETRMVRVHGDLADMIGWLVRIEGGTVAGLLDPLLRPQLVARYERIRPAVEQITKLRESAKKKDERRGRGSEN